MTITYSDRSTVLRHQECARSRWFEAEVPTPEGFGVVRKKVDPNLLVGIAYHEGVNRLQGGASEDEACGQAREVQSRVLGEAGLGVQEGEDTPEILEYLTQENFALGEALIRGHARVVLPQTLERFEILDLEREEITKLTIPQLPYFTLVFGGRTDGIFLDKSSGDLFIQSLKTKKEWKSGDEEKNRTDTQGLTEWIAVESRLAGWARVWQDCFDKDHDLERLDLPEWFKARMADGNPPQVLGVTMQYALKGKSEKKDGVWKSSSPLIRPWRKVGTSGPAGWAWKFSWDDAMGGGHRLGKGWGRVNIWEVLSVKDWIDLLWEEDVQGLGVGAGLTSQFILPEDYYRNEEDRERRTRQIVFQEARVQEGRERLVQIQVLDLPPREALDAVEVVLDEFFPQHSDYPNNCGWCEYEKACYGPRGWMVDPLSSGFYTPRVSNHPVEVGIRGRGKVRGHEK